jgi:hypothetical protein
VSGASAPPRISVVTPSYNQARFLEPCLRSVLDQRYPNLEYIVVDGGSTDGSVAIIERLEKDLAYWVSEPDGGHYDALNKGFRRATGDVLAWLNSDDLYTPWTLAVVADVFRRLPEVQWLSTLYPLFWNEAGIATSCAQVSGFDRGAALRRDQVVQQESTFWRRSLWERVGGALDTSFALAADLDLWARFWEHADLHGLAVPLGGIRRHAGQRHIRHVDAYRAEAAAIAGRYGLRIRRGRGPVRATLRRVMATAAPRRLGPLLHRAGLCYRGPVVSQRGRDGTWDVRTVYFP